jgi:hypothetical protein
MHCFELFIKYLKLTDIIIHEYFDQISNFLRIILIKSDDKY